MIKLYGIKLQLFIFHLGPWEMSSLIPKGNKKKQTSMISQGREQAISMLHCIFSFCSLHLLKPTLIFLACTGPDLVGPCSRDTLDNFSSRWPSRWSKDWTGINGYMSYLGRQDFLRVPWQFKEISCILLLQESLLPWLRS